MADAGGRPIVPTTIEGMLVQLQRRLNEVENRERGTGRRGWSEATVLLAGATPLDNGFPSWRFLNDGRVELRGRLSVTTPVANTTPGTKVLRLPGRAAPPGDGVTYRGWLSALAPCSTSVTNPGVYRLDVERTIVNDVQPIDPETGLPAVDDDGAPILQDLIYADIIARPAGGTTLTDWIGFDHVIFDPNLYIDALAPVPEADHNRVFGKGYPSKDYPREDGAHVVQEIPGEFGIAVLSYVGGGMVAVVPGVEAPAAPPGLEIPAP